MELKFSQKSCYTLNAVDLLFSDYWFKYDKGYNELSLKNQSQIIYQCSINGEQ